jgi:hypothetical protein
VHQALLIPSENEMIRSLPSLMNIQNSFDSSKIWK